MKKDVKLYNVMFPLWMIMTMPQAWYVMIPANFLVDSLVLLAAMAMLKMKERKDFFKKHILKVFAMGFLGDILGAVPLWIAAYGFELGGTYGDSLALTLPGLLLAAVLIYFLDYHIAFRDVKGRRRRELALIYAIVTAPYTFLIPTQWIYRF